MNEYRAYEGKQIILYYILYASICVCVLHYSMHHNTLHESERRSPPPPYLYHIYLCEIFISKSFRKVNKFAYYLVLLVRSDDDDATHHTLHTGRIRTKYPITFKNYPARLFLKIVHTRCPCVAYK